MPSTSSITGMAASLSRPTGRITDAGSSTPRVITITAATVPQTAGTPSTRVSAVRTFPRPLAATNTPTV